jgi:hypothetical protein
MEARPLVGTLVGHELLLPGAAVHAVFQGGQGESGLVRDGGRHGPGAGAIDRVGQAGVIDGGRGGVNGAGAGGAHQVRPAAQVTLGIAGAHAVVPHAGGLVHHGVGRLGHGIGDGHRRVEGLHGAEVVDVDAFLQYTAIRLVTQADLDVLPHVGRQREGGRHESAGGTRDAVAVVGAVGIGGGGDAARDGGPGQAVRGHFHIPVVPVVLDVVPRPQRDLQAGRDLQAARSARWWRCGCGPCRRSSCWVH